MKIWQGTTNIHNSKPLKLEVWHNSTLKKNPPLQPLQPNEEQKSDKNEKDGEQNEYKDSFQDISNNFER